MMNYEQNLEKAKKKALRLLTYRPRTEHEIYSRLTRDGFTSSTVEELVEYLKQYGYLNDRTFAEEWVRFRLNKGNKGRHHLYRELIHKGIAGDLAREVVDSIPEDLEYSIILKAAEKKMKSGCSPGALAGYLERQGFPRSLIYKACHYLFDEY